MWWRGGPGRSHLRGKRTARPPQHRSLWSRMPLTPQEAILTTLPGTAQLQVPSLVPVTSGCSRSTYMPEPPPQLKAGASSVLFSVRALASRTEPGTNVHKQNTLQNEIMPPCCGQNMERFILVGGEKWGGGLGGPDTGACRRIIVLALSDLLPVLPTCRALLHMLFPLPCEPPVPAWKHPINSIHLPAPSLPDPLVPRDMVLENHAPFHQSAWTTFVIMYSFLWCCEQRPASPRGLQPPDSRLHLCFCSHLSPASSTLHGP